MIKYPDWFEIKVKVIHHFGSVKDFCALLLMDSKKIRAKYQHSDAVKREIITLLERKEKQNCKFAMRKVKGGAIKPIRLLPKATCTITRMEMEQAVMEKFRITLQDHIAFSPRGEMSRMAHAIGVNQSQIHKWTCPVCEHNQKPSFVVGMALMAYIGWHSYRPIIDFNPRPYNQNARKGTTYKQNANN